MIRVTRHGWSLGTGTDGLPVRQTDVHSDPSAVAWRYSIAGQDVVFQTRVNALKHFHAEPASPEYTTILNDLAELAPIDRRHAQLFYKGQAPFADEQRDVMCWRTDDLVQISIDQQQSCVLALDDNHIHILNRHDFDEALNLELVTGPAMMLLFAKLGLYSLHASAVATPYGNIAFIGESGAGKSTLAEHQSDDWVQLADDIVPLQHWAEHVKLLDYPQLKLVDATPERQFPSDVSLDFLVRVRPEASEDIVIRQLPRTDAMLQIIRHTVAARLFDRPQLRAHLKFARYVSGVIPMVELSYPREHKLLPELRNAIGMFLQSGDFERAD